MQPMAEILVRAVQLTNATSTCISALTMNTDLCFPPALFSATRLTVVRISHGGGGGIEDKLAAPFTFAH